MVKKDNAKTSKVKLELSDEQFLLMMKGCIIEDLTQKEASDLIGFTRQGIIHRLNRLGFNWSELKDELCKVQSEEGFDNVKNENPGIITVEFTEDILNKVLLDETMLRKKNQYPPPKLMNENGQVFNEFNNYPKEPIDEVEQWSYEEWNHFFGYPLDSEDCCWNEKAAWPIYHEFQNPQSAKEIMENSLFYQTIIDTFDIELSSKERLNLINIGKDKFLELWQEIGWTSYYSICKDRYWEWPYRKDYPNELMEDKGFREYIELKGLVDSGLSNNLTEYGWKIFNSYERKNEVDSIILSKKPEWQQLKEIERKTGMNIESLVKTLKLNI
jgi:hypothetical protein